MPFSTETNKNQNNVDFIKKFFPDEDVDLSYPDFNYRVRMAELTNFWPYYSEAAKDSSETDAQYDARVETSGRLFGSQHIVLNDIVHNNRDVSGMIIGQDYAGHVPEVMFYIEKCKLLEGGKEYEVRPKNLNDENFLINGSPQVIFPVDLSQTDKGYYCYRKTSSVQKNNNKLVDVQSGWEKVAEFSNKDIKNYIAGVDLSDEKRNMGFSFIDSGVSGYSGWTNELMTSYKILDSGSVENVSDDTYYLRKSRTVNYLSDPNKTYTLERKVSRASNNSTTNPPAWELVSPQAEFPYTDTEILSNTITGGVDFKVEGIYEVVKPVGGYAESNLDYFQVDLMEDWGKSKEKSYTFRQDSKELTFESGEALRVVQKSNSYFNPRANSHDILGVVETSFSPSSTGISGSVSGANNAENFYELEYQLLPKEREFKKLYYETGSFDGISVGDRVFFNSGANQAGSYSPIETNVFGDSVDELDSRSPIMEEVSQSEKEEYIGPSYVSGLFHTIEPKEALGSESSDVGWSHFSSGEKYLVVPKGGYNNLDFQEDKSLLSYSAGELRSTFYQGNQSWGDEDTEYALTEYRTFDPVNNTEEPYIYNKEKEIRISDQALCLGESATELPDRKNPKKVFLLDFEYGSDQIFRNASILNIDHTDGSIGISNLKSNKEEYERKPNLFFEKEYIGSLTILATGQKQDHDISTLKEIISTERGGDSSVFYLERDIYIDSDVLTQSNSVSPTVFSTDSGGASDPFALSERSPNPSVRGEEKLYLTETYHKTPKEYPFTDSSYFIKRPTVTETFEYLESFDYEEKSFNLTNIENESTYNPSSFSCSLNYDKNDAGLYDGYGLLTYRGVSLTGSASVTDITFAGLDAGKRTIAFTPLNTGVYYEVQARYKTNPNRNWTDVSSAIDIHDGMLAADGSASISLNNNIFTTSNTDLEIRALEWNKSNISTVINSQRVTSESPDSLILKSEANNVFYDWSKLGHAVTNHGAVPSFTTSAGDIFPSVVSDVVHFDTTDNSKYLSFASHRSFDIQNGDFSMEFWINSDSSYDSGRNNYIIKRVNGFEASIDTSNKIQFKIGEYTLSSESSFTQNDWVHVAISANFNKRTKELDLSLFVDGKLEDSFSKQENMVYFGELSASGDEDLIIGQGFKGKLYGVRIYIGRSNYTGDFAKPTAPFEKEAAPKSYKILKYKSTRAVSNQCDWIVNKNTFNNVSPPDIYKETIDPAEPFFMSEWAQASSTTENMGSKYNRALINYVNGYAYNAPNNPHINKNYEGTPIERYLDTGKPSVSEQLDSIVFDNYKYIDKNASSSKQVQAAPYLYEYIKETDLDLVRQNNKGGWDIPLEDESETPSSVFNKGSRLRITKYVYKLYTKRAVVVADLGYKNNRGHQSGWSYRLQSSINSGSTWVDLASDSTTHAENIFYNNEYSFDSATNGFGNISSFSSLPIVLLKSDITKKYRTNAIQFRVKKEQNISLGASSDTGKVLKKLNFLPLEVDIPSSNCLLDITQQAEHSKVISAANWTEVKLDKNSAYILVKSSEEEVFEPSNPVSVSSITDSRGIVVSSITESSGVATVTASALHYLETGDTVTISGATPAVYNGDFEVVSVTGSYTFTFSIASGTGAESSGAIVMTAGTVTATATTGRDISVSSVVELLGTATATTSAAHRLVTGDAVAISGAAPAAYNDNFVVTVTGSTTFTFSIASGTGNPSGTITANITEAHYLKTGDTVTISGATPVAYNAGFKVAVHGDSTFTFPIAKGTGSASGTITAYRTSVNKLKINSLTFSEGEANLTDDYYGDDLVKDNFSDLPNGQPVEFKGLTGLRISGKPNYSRPNIGSIKTVVGIKPSGITLNRVEKSYKGKSSDDYVRTGEFFDLNFGGTKAFITPSVTGSHFDELQGFNSFADQPIDSIENDSVGGLENSIINFSCKSYTTGEGQATEDEEGNVILTHPSIGAGVSGVEFSPLNQFYNSPVITGDITIGEEDAGKTFITSGILTLTNEASDITVANITQSTDLTTVGNPTTITAETPVPTATLFTSSSLARPDDIVIIQDSGRVNIANWDSTESTGIVNIFTGDVNNIKLNNSLSVNENVVFAEHGKINLTKEDAGETIVVNCASDVILPDGVSNNNEISFINGTQYETKVLSESSSHTIGSSNNKIDYIPRESTRKYKYNSTNDNWSTSDVSLIKFNQLNLTYSDFLSTGNTVVHNEDVDVRISTTSSISVSSITESVGVATATTSANHSLQTGDTVTISGAATAAYNASFAVTGTGDTTFTFSVNSGTGTASGENIIAKTDITENEYINIVRNQVNNFDIESDLSDWSTPIIRVYVDGALKHVAPSGSLGVRISKTSEGWKFKKVKPIILNEVVITPESGGSIFSYNSSGDSVSIKFSDDTYPLNFKIFLISNQESLTNININAYSENESVKFLNKNGEETGYYFEIPMDKKSVVSLSKEQEGLNFVIKEEDQSNIYKFNQPVDSEGDPDGSTRVIINRNENFGLELPSITENFNHEAGFDLIFCNFSETSCLSKTPIEDTSKLDSNIPSLKSRNYKYINPNKFSSSYDKFKSTSKIKDSSEGLNDGDFVVLDGSVSDVRLKSFGALSGAIKEHKFSRTKLERDIGIEGEIAKYITYNPSNTASECLFTLKNHELTTGQKLVFNCDKLFVADHYYDASPDSAGTRTAFEGTNSIGQDVNAGESVLIFDYYEGDLGKRNYALFVSKGGSDLKQEPIDLPNSITALFDSSYEVQPANVSEPDKIYVHIKNAALDGSNPLPKIYDIYANDEGLAVEKALANRIPFNLAIDEEDDTSVTKKQTFFVEVVDDNKFKLYKDSARTAQVTKTAPISLLSDTFYVENINVGSLNVINLGNSNTTIKNYSEEMDIVSPLAAMSETTVHQHSSSAYTTADATASGVYFATGWNGASDTLDISDLSQSTVFLSGKFHAKANLSADTSFNSKYYVNAGLDEVVITDEGDGDSLDKLEKNRVYKHIGGGDDASEFKKQDQNSSLANESDIIYYPKNELHVLDRKTLSKDDAQQDYNFVFFKPDEYSDDLKVVLPDAWGNIDPSTQIGFAVVNLHNREVTVSNFTGDQTFSLSAGTVAFITSATDYSDDSTPPKRTEKNLYDNFVKVEGRDQYNITLGSEVYKFAFFEDSNEVQVLQDKPYVKDYWARYYILKPGDITIDHSIHHNKKIFIDGPVNFLRPYLSSNDGLVDYSGDKYDNKTDPSVPTAFQIANISRDPVDVYVNGEVPGSTANGYTVASDDNDNQRQVMYSSQFYSVEINAFKIDEQEMFSDEYFKHFTLERDSSWADSFEYPATNLNSTKAYNIFGVELPIKLNVYASVLDTGDAEKINIVFPLEQDGSQIEASSYYKVSGIGATDIPKFNIINSVYEDVKISSVSVKGDTLNGNAILESKIKKVFDDTQIPIQDAFKSYTISSEGEINEMFSESFTPKLLGRNKALSISLAEMVDSRSGDREYTCSALEGTSLNLPSQLDYVNQSGLIKIKKREVKTLKKETISASLADAVFSEASFSRSITSISDPFDIALPHRSLIGDKDFDFILINASRSDVNVVFPEGVGSGFSILKGKTKQIKYNSSTKAYGSAVDVETEELNKGLYSTNLDLFLVSESSTTSKPFKVKGADSDPNKVKVINNTGETLYIQAMGGGAQKTINRNSYSGLTFEASNTKEDGQDVNIKSTKIRDGSALLNKTYINEVVLFNSNVINLLEFSRESSSSAKFFKTDIVPFINDTKFKRSGMNLARTEAYAGSYTIRNDKQTPEEETVAHINPIKLTAGGAKTVIDVSCYLFEFILENINEKVAYPNKDYDYIIKDSANFSCTLYNGNIGFNGGTYFFRLDDKGNLIDNNVDDTGNNTLKSSYSAEGKPVFKITQTGTVVTPTRGQAYSDEKFEWSAEDEDERGSRRFLYQKFYLNKASYNGKIIIFKDPFDIIYTTTDVNDSYYYSKASGTRLVNISKASCYRNKAIGKTESELYSEYYMSASAGVGFPVVRPKYTLTPDENKLHVLRHLADVEQLSMNNLKIANVSRGTINITYEPDDGSSAYLKWNIFSSERADFSLTAFAKDIYIDKKGNEVIKNVPPVEWLDIDENKHSIYTKYSEVRKQDKRDWFIRLTDLDVPHFIKDSSYFDEQEWQMERRTEKLGQINVDYNAVRFKFSNIFRTNKQDGEKGQTGFQSIEDYDDPYKFGVTLFSNKKGIQRKVFWEKDVSDKFFPVYLKLPWDMPKDLIAYALSTGHERLSRCLHFNERSGEITLGGILPDKNYSLESEKLSSYDFVHEATTEKNQSFNEKDYMRSLDAVAFQPNVIYNNKVYFSGEKIEGGSLSEYKVSFPYFSTLNVSQFSRESSDDSKIDFTREEEKRQMQIDISDEEREKGRDLRVLSITESSGTATATTSEAHSFQTGSTVTITGATPEAYNDSFEVTVTAAEEGATADDIAAAAATFTFSIEEGTGDTSEEATIVVNIKDLDPIVFSWDKVTKDFHESDFLSGRVESITTYDSSAKQELILGRKIKDIKGSYSEEIWKTSSGEGYKAGDLTKFGEIAKDTHETHWLRSLFFKFTIPLNAGFTYSKQDSDEEKIIIKDKYENEIKDIGLAEEGYTAEVTIRFIHINDNKYVELPGLEYEISASLAYNRSVLQTAGGTNVKAAQISLEPKDSMPFVADGHISSLNEDFSSPEADEYIVRAISNLRQKYKNNEQDEKYQKTLGALEQSRNNEVYQSLKNNLGYSFAPAFGLAAGHDPMVGLQFNLKRNLKSYRAIRFRLKRLTDRRITFDDLTKDEKIGSYLTNNATEANLQYQLETTVNSIAYHDIAHPGGVATMPVQGWSNVVLSGSDLELPQCADGDGIVFKEDNGEIKAGKVYFIRVNNVNIGSSVLPSKYKVDVLKIYCDSEVSSAQGLDNLIKVNSSLTTSSPAQKYKIINYFNLGKKAGEVDHRGESSIIDKLYPEGAGSSDDRGLAGGSTFNFPIIVGSKKFYLERAVYQNPGDTTEFDTWPDTVWERGVAGFKVRANLEMSEIAQTFISDFGGHESMTTFNDPGSYWRSEDIFNGVKNLLYRDNTQMQLVNWYESGGSIIVKVNVKLTKGREYRCLFNNEKWTEGTINTTKYVVYESAISSVSFDGVKKTASFCDIFTASSGDLTIELNATAIDIVKEQYVQLDIFSETIDGVDGNKDLILNHIKGRVCIVESAGFVDQTIKVDGDNLEAVDYIDYQIPMLNNPDERSFGFINPDSFYYTEEYDNIFTRDQRWENLTREGSGLLPLKNDKFNGLMYNGAMPADIKYIYPRCQRNDHLSFYISNDFWDGFIDMFAPENEYGSKSDITKPKNIDLTLQELVDGEWGASTLSVTVNKDSRKGKTAYAEVVAPGVIVGKTYRLAVGGEEVEYYEDGAVKTFSNSLMRVPFSWKSTIFASDVSSVANVSRGDVREHNISLIENHLLQKSISFPKEGVSKFGSYSYKKGHPNFKFKIPYTRRYMYRLSHNIGAVYVDKLNHGGISRVEITNPGSDYRLAPDVTIASPENGTAAIAKATIESGKLKFIEVTNNGSGYSDLSKLNTTKFINNNWGKGSVVKKEWLIQAAKLTYTFTLDGTKTITHDGVKNVVFGSYVSGTGIPAGTKITKVNSSTKFEISHSATASGVQSLTIDIVERQMPYISLEDQFGVETAEVALKTIDPASLPKNDPRYDDPCQESFGVDFEESEVIANYTDSESGSDLAAAAISSVKNYVSLVEGATEDPNWLNVPDKASLIGDLDKEEGSSSVESKEIASYGKTTEGEYVDTIKGTEHPSVDGFYIAKESDDTEQMGTTIRDNGHCQKEVFPSVSVGTAKAVVNNQSLAEYRVVENSIANTATPWITSFSREEDSSQPKGFGINPGSPLTSEVFNNYARAINNMSLVGAYVPIFARVRKFRQYEYRHIDNMGGITFAEENPYNAGGEITGGNHGIDYSVWEGESKINFIDYIDPNDRKHKTAWFSADFGTKVERNDDKNIFNQGEVDLYSAPYKDPFTVISGESYDPPNIGLPTIVNIPEELGVFCNPRESNTAGWVSPKDAGINLPSLNNRRASVFGGELVHTSEAYDISDEDGIVNIAGSDIIDTSYENEIIFGCQVRGKSFWSTFLKTTREWTEFEVVPSPSFVESISSDEGMGSLTQLKGSVTRYTTLCDNKEFSKVGSTTATNHSLCDGGSNHSQVSEFSYEALFNLRNGDSVVGPVEDSHEFVFDQTFGGEGTQVFKMDPEFTQALAVYGSHGYDKYTKSNANAQAGEKLHGITGPCIHKCSPSSRAVFNASDEQLAFDLMAGSKSRKFNPTTRMPRLRVFVDPVTGEKSYRYE